MKLTPQFPLQLVVYPGENLNLHIFEPRYRQLINECYENGTTFGIPAFINGKVQNIGTEVELVSIEKTFSGGEMDVKTRGVGIYRIRRFFNKAPDKLYAAGETEDVDFDVITDPVLQLKALEKLAELYDLLNVQKELPTDASEFFTYEWAHHLGCNLEQEHEILSIPSETDRLEYVYEHLNKLLPVVRETELLRKKAMMNGHFKNVLPPEF